MDDASFESHCFGGGYVMRIGEGRNEGNEVEMKERDKDVAFVYGERW